MQVCEFKAWFEGFTEDMGAKLPTVKQWARIKARIDEIDEIDGAGEFRRVFHDHYWRPYAPHWPQTTDWTSLATQTTSTNPQQHVSCNYVQLTGTETVQNASQAFTALGKADAASATA